MANIGEIGEIVIADHLTLEVGADTYIMLTDLLLHVGRPEFASHTTDAGTVWSLGKGDNWFTFKLTLTTPELDSLNTLTQTDANGDYTSTAWKLVASNRSGATKTMAVDGYLRDYEMNKAAQGKLDMDCFVRVTGDTITIT